jgi:hypothetical protein
LIENSNNFNKHDLNKFFELNYNDLLPEQQRHINKTIKQTDDNSFYVVDTIIPIFEDNCDNSNENIDKREFFILDTYWIDDTE